MAYTSKYKGKEIDDLLDKVAQGGAGGSGNSDNNYTDADKALVQTIPSKADKDGYYPSMSVGMADNLVGRGDVQDAHINFRPSAGAGTNITDGAARIKAIKGNSVVWNQLRFDEIVGNEYTYHEVEHSGKSLSIGGAVQNYATLRVGQTAILNHYYYIGCEVINNDFAIASICSNSQQMLIDALLLSNSGFCETIVKKNTEHASINTWRFVIADAEYNDKYATLDNLVIIDLTKMFGAGNEPTTIEQYNERKPMNIDEYAYNEGEIISVKVDALKSVGDNAYNTKSTPKSARVIGGLAYEITLDGEYVTPEMATVSFDYGDIDKEDIEVVPNENNEYIFPENGKIYVDGYGEGAIVCVCIKHSYPKHSQFYEENTKDLSWIADIEYEGAALFPKGLRSAGSAYDEIYFDRTTKKWEAVKRIGEVDLGSLKWYKQTSGNNTTRFYTPSTSFAPKPVAATNQIANFTCSKYITTTADKTYMANGCISLSAPDSYNPYGLLYVYDAAQVNSTGDEFKTALDGVMLYYELAEPIVVELDFPTAETNMDYLVWDFGTEEAIASVPSAPFRADINYEPNAVDDLRWAVSEIRSLKAQLAQIQTSVTNLTD